MKTTTTKPTRTENAAAKRAARRQDLRQARQDAAAYYAARPLPTPATVAVDAEVVETPLVEVLTEALPVEFLLARVGL